MRNYEREKAGMVRNGIGVVRVGMACLPGVGMNLSADASLLASELHPERVQPPAIKLIVPRRRGMHGMDNLVHPVGLSSRTNPVDNTLAESGPAPPQHLEGVGPEFGGPG